MATEKATVAAVGSHEGEVAAPGPDEQRNYALGVVNGSVGALGRAFIEPNLVLAAFVFDVTNSKLLVGVLATLTFGGMLLPQLYFSRLIEHLPRKRPFYILMTVVRSSAVAVMAGLIWLTWWSGARWPVYVFLAVYFLFRGGDGGGMLAFYDLVGGAVRRRRLGGFFARRGLLGDAMALAASLVIIQPVIEHVDSPLSYAILATVGTAVVTVAWVAMCFTRETDGDDPPAERRFWQTVREAAGVMMHDRSYRALIGCRVLARVNMLLPAFFVPYGAERLGIVKASGLFVAFWTGSRMIGGPVWGRVVDRAGPRACMIASGALFAISPMLALLAPHLPRMFVLPVPLAGVRLDGPLVVYLLALCVFGVAFRSNMIGIGTLMVEGAPAARRASYIAFLNTVTLPVALLPVVAGLLVNHDIIPFDAVFATAAVSGAASIVVATGLRRRSAPDTPPV